MRDWMDEGGVHKACKECVARDGVDSQRVAPNGVGMDIYGAIWRNERVGKCECFAWLIEEIAANIVEGVEAIGAWLDIMNGKSTLGIGASDACEGQCRECRIVVIAMDTYQHIGHGVEVGGIIDGTRDGKRVDDIACRERENIARERRLLVVVTDSRTEVDGVGGRVLQFLHKDHREVFANGLDLWRILLRWGDEDFVGYIIKLDILVEIHLHLLACE